MSQANEKLSRRMFDEIWNDKDPGKMDEFYADDFTGHGFGSESGGLDDYRGFYDLITGAFPDVQFETELLFSDGDLAGATWHATATHDGPFMGFEPTNKEATINGISLHRVEDGKITEAWMQYDAMKLLQTVGAIPELAPAADDD